jgi:hypothetical protein
LEIIQNNLSGGIHIGFTRYIIRIKKNMNFKSAKNIFSFLMLVFITASCYKISNSTATVTVVDKKDKTISGATVHVFPVSSTPEDSLTINESLNETKVTDNNGQVFFDYTEYYKNGQTGLFVLNMEVTYVLPDTTIKVLSILKVEEQMDNQKEVKMPFIL